MPKIPAKYGKVLFVDDEKDIGDLFGDTFNDLGITWKYASNGAIALEILETENFDLVISDIRMPIMDGFRLLQEIKKRKIEVPEFIFLTGYADHDPADLIKAGAKAVYGKPLDLSDLEKILRKN